MRRLRSAKLDSAARCAGGSRPAPALNMSASFSVGRAAWRGSALAATAGAIGVRLGGASLRPLQALDDGQAQPVSAPSVAGSEGLPGEPARTSHFTQVVGLVWRTVALWLLALVLLTLAHVLG